MRFEGARAPLSLGATAATLSGILALEPDRERVGGLSITRSGSAAADIYLADGRLSSSEDVRYKGVLQRYFIKVCYKKITKYEKYE